MLKKVLAQLLDFGDVHLAPWVIPVFIVAIVVLMWPRFERNVRISKSRRIVMRMSGEPLPVREGMAKEALDLAGDEPLALSFVAEEAARAGHEPLAEEALSRLRATGKRPADARRIEKLLFADVASSPAAAAVAVEKLIGIGATEGAREKLRRARKRYPDEPALRAIEERLAASSTDTVQNAPGQSQ